jgi:hypothetical protein
MVWDTRNQMHKNACLLLLSLLPLHAQTSWKFAVGGDSRNCGDIVMPAIAASVVAQAPEFYWHLGDFRAIYTFDEDMVPPHSLGLNTKPLSIIDYENTAWSDFIAHQLGPFGSLPVMLGPGNHEVIPPSTRERYLIQFADWLNTPKLSAQRLADDPADHKLRSYYHWRERNVEFISLDNAGNDQFDSAQMKWFQATLERAEKSPEIRTIVVGLHAALPGSIGDSHSVSNSAQGDKSGREVHEALWHARSVAKKNVYILASHSHFFLEDVYRTATWKDKVIPGWIVGTAGAVRYRLPEGVTPGPKAMTDVYGYLLGTVDGNGEASFSFQKVGEEDLLRANRGQYPEALVRWCVAENRELKAK